MPVGSYGLLHGIPLGFVWFSYGFLLVSYVLRCWSVLSCVVIVVRSLFPVFIKGIFQGASRIPKGPLGFLWVDDDAENDDVVVAADVAAAVDAAVSDDDDDDTGHGDDHHHHPQAIHTKYSCDLC